MRDRRLQPGVSSDSLRYIPLGGTGRQAGDAIAERRDYPCLVVSGNGTEPTSNAMLAWQQ